MNLLFFDVVPTNIVRFFKGLVHEFENSETDTNCFFLLEEDDHNDISHVEASYPKAKDISYVKTRNIKWFKDYLTDNRIDAVIINAQRIPDDLVVLASKSLNIKTFMLQHGMYIPFLKRNIAFFLNKIEKTCRYLYYATKISQEMGYGRFGLVHKYFKCYVLGANQVEENIPRASLNVDMVYVYGDYWKQFHTSQFGYTDKQQKVVGYPDLEDIYLSDLNDISEGVCYIAQTLVEDGRLNKKTQLKFFEKLVDATLNNKLPLTIKLHPRSDLMLFKYAEKFTHVHFVNDEFPKVKKYIGHYSTLLAKGMIVSGDVCIFEFLGHPTPMYFEESASEVLNKLEDLDSWLEKSIKIESNTIEKYFECKPNVNREIYIDIIKQIRQI